MSDGSAGSLEDVWRRLSETSASRARHLGEALIERGLLDASALAKVLHQQTALPTHRLIGQLLVDNGHLRQEDLDAVLTEWLGVPKVDPRLLTPETQALERLPRAMALRHTVLPLMVRDDTLVVVVVDPWDYPLLDELRFAAQLRVVPVVSVGGALPAAVARAYGQGQPAMAGPADGQTAAGAAFARRDIHELAAELQVNTEGGDLGDATVISESDNTLVRLINTVISDAIELRASDIHIETADAPRNVKVRLRIDGELQRYVEVPARFRFALVARLKIMADLNIAEHRKPQDGKIDFARFGGPHVELRMVTVPTVHGLEDVVLRLLSGLRPMPLESIGLSSGNLTGLRRLMAKSFGLVLVCGPTGCGKTTTLHSLMRELNTDRRKIWTAEDPVEITQEGLRQVQMNARIGWTFANAMRTFLRADPDVIMIGEMRDQETAGVAVEASLTGHLVMSTLHTNSAPESITRLLEIGLDPFTFADSLLGILAQRLVRRLCMHCRVARPLSDEAIEELAGLYLASGRAGELTPEDLIARWRRNRANVRGGLLVHEHRGCQVCDGHGYKGRLGLHELMVSDERIRQLIHRRAPAAELQAAALTGGMVTLRQDGIEKVLAGLTDMVEVLTATNV